MTKCDYCRLEVNEAEIVDVVAGAIHGEKHDGVASEYTIRSTEGGGLPASEEWCVDCSRQVFGVDSPRSTPRRISWSDKYIKPDTVMTFIAGFVMAFVLFSFLLV